MGCAIFREAGNCGEILNNRGVSKCSPITWSVDFSFGVRIAQGKILAH